MPVMATPEQTGCDDGVTVATGAGFTSTVALLVQVLPLRVMVNVTYAGAIVVLFNIPLMLPDPLAAMPVIDDVLSLVQL